MIDKKDFYHGAVLISIFEHKKFQNIVKVETGYIINDINFVYIKYSTKSRTPWNFSFNNYEIKKIKLISSQHNVYLPLVCGGDGICSINYEEFLYLLNDQEGSISAKRKHNESYEVKGTNSKLKNKIKLQRWPLILF